MRCREADGYDIIMEGASTTAVLCALLYACAVHHVTSNYIA